MRRIFGDGGSRPAARYARGGAVKLRTALPAQGLRAGTIGTVATARPAEGPSYGVRFAGAGGPVVVQEADLIPADGRNHDAGDVVSLTKDVPMQGLRAGDVGVVSAVSPGPPVKYTVEFPEATTTLLDEAVSSVDETLDRLAEEPGGQEERADDGGTGSTGDEGPDETGLSDGELDELIAELRSRGRTTRGEEPRGQEQKPEEARLRQARSERVDPEDAREEYAKAPVRPRERLEQPSAGGADHAPPSDGRRTRFVRGEAVRLGADLPSAGIGAGTEGTVTWTIMGQPVSYLVEFGGGAPTKVEEIHLSPAE